MKFQIYSKDNCQFCFRAAALLTSRELPFEEFKLGVHFTREELLEQFPDAKSFPQIKLVSVNGDMVHFIGGFVELKMFLAKPQN